MVCPLVSVFVRNWRLIWRAATILDQSLQCISRQRKYTRTSCLSYINETCGSFRNVAFSPGKRPWSWFEHGVDNLSTSSSVRFRRRRAMIVDISHGGILCAKFSTNSYTSTGQSLRGFGLFRRSFIILNHLAYWSFLHTYLGWLRREPWSCGPYGSPQHWYWDWGPARQWMQLTRSRLITWYL